ncbi:hypothetical protein A7Q10_04760 [Methylacidiphilum caldifontis]|uniref:Uncharacterized protein n=1 Tax=Methylacidiphilum caldifontis TaxID=2795386 RepID=A0A4Y8PGG2_9BACT|nr:hypothetical protein A7Q10_04760 [Methylacidiphilum caldifontis]
MILLGIIGSIYFGRSSVFILPFLYKKIFYTIGFLKKFKSYDCFGEDFLVGTFGFGGGEDEEECTRSTR